MWTTRAGGSGPSARSRSARDRPRTGSMTIQGAPVLAGDPIVEGEDAGMLQPGGACLPIQARDPDLPLGGIRVLGQPELFDGHLPAQPLVVGTPDDPHTALPQQPGQPVPARMGSYWPARRLGAGGQGVVYAERRAGSTA
ncbi:hypothetical protein ACIBF6_32490 [Streptosporangium amethystogenes]|uniref:hypothetical protein n=1 Tax=Streptosporangium amethystogenes TaxID=2002 RepID=UPI003795348E